MRAAVVNWPKGITSMGSGNAPSRATSTQYGSTLIGVERTDLLGQSGTALTNLRPSGTATIAGRRVDVVTEGGMIERGTLPVSSSGPSGVTNTSAVVREPDRRAAIARALEVAGTDDVVVVEIPAMLVAIGYHYADFSEVTDDDVQAVLSKGKR